MRCSWGTKRSSIDLVMQRFLIRPRGVVAGAGDEAREAGEGQSQEESDFMWWFHIHRPNYLTDKGRQMVANLLPVNTIEFGRKLAKGKFYEFKDTKGQPAVPYLLVFRTKER